MLINDENVMFSVIKLHLIFGDDCNGFCEEGSICGVHKTLWTPG